MTVLNYGGPKKRNAEQTIFDKWPQPTESRSWKSASKAKSLMFRDIPEAKSIDDLITPASTTGKQVVENLDFKIARGLRQILTGKFKKQVTTAEGKAQSERGDHSQADRSLGWSTTSSKLVATMQPSRT